MQVNNLTPLRPEYIISAIRVNSKKDDTLTISESPVCYQRSDDKYFTFLNIRKEEFNNNFFDKYVSVLEYTLLKVKENDLSLSPLKSKTDFNIKITFCMEDDYFLMGEEGYELPFLATKYFGVPVKIKIIFHIGLNN